ncbi:endonuclease domain-containing protein [Leucobacter chinensis]|uniref:endonuclease domain-containing protein n=1 Tax=Leucobacter chinensis TaxID=2851010 RepID=UPI001C23D00E|nr:hypothetical protein [Leucobacter chinensis]
MNRRAPFPHFDADALRVSEVISRGATKGRVQSKDMPRASHGIVVNPSLMPLHSLELRCRALLPVLRPADAFSRFTAAELYGLPLPQTRERSARNPPPIDIVTELPARALRRVGVAGHSVRPETIEVYRVAGLPVTSPADTWCMLAGRVSHERLVALGDALLTGQRMDRGGGQRSPPLATLADLYGASAQHQRSVGSVARAAALPLLRWPVDSPAESALRLRIREAGLPEPQVNCTIEVEGLTLHADLGYPTFRVAIEYEGQYHFSGGEEQARFDVERHELMIAAGWRVLRATARDLRAPQGFIRRLTTALP